MAYPVLYLMRHAEAASGGTLAGQAEYPLTAAGERQAMAWRPFFAENPVAAAWASPLSRARQTAELALGDARVPVTLVPELREISLGLWEGKSGAWAREHFPEAWAARGRDFCRAAPPGGESLLMLAARVLPAFRAILAEAARYPASLLVAHQAVNRVILADIAGTPLEDALSLPQDYAALTTLCLIPEGPRISAGSMPPP